MKNKAVFHKKCTVEYGQARLDSLKRKFEESEATLRNETETSVSPNKTRRSFAATNFTEMCFFVKSKHVKSWASYLCDDKLLAKLSEGDMCATEPIYHKNCLTSRYNKFKSKKQAERPEIELLRKIAENALDDVVEYIKDTITLCHEGNTTSVFMQKSSTDMYNQHLMFYGASEEFTEKTQCTRIREKIMVRVPGQCKANDGQKVTLSIDDDVGRALFEACESASEDPLKVIAKAASIIRRQIFLNVEEFDGDVSQRQLKSVPYLLVKLISSILEGGKTDRGISDSLEIMSTTIAQIIRFNSVKQTRDNTCPYVPCLYLPCPYMLSVRDVSVRAVSVRALSVRTVSIRGLSLLTISIRMCRASTCRVCTCHARTCRVCMCRVCTYPVRTCRVCFCRVRTCRART